MSPTRHAEQALLVHLSDPDSLDTLAREGFLTAEAREVIPTDLIRRMLDWALSRFFADGRQIAPSREAIVATWGDKLEELQVQMPDDQVETDTVGFVVDDLRSNHARVMAEKWTTDFAGEIARADGAQRVAIFNRYAEAMFATSQSLVSRRNEVDGFYGSVESMGRLLERKANGQASQGMTFGIPMLDNHMFGIHPGEICVVCGESGTGKAAWVETPVATPDGWSTMGALQVGDQVFDERGELCTVTGKSPVWQHDTYRVTFDDGASVVVNGEHEWNVFDRRRNLNRTPVRDWRTQWDRSQTMSTAALVAEGLVRSPRNISWRWSVACAGPLDGSKLALPVDPYLLGVWLGDGGNRDAEITLNDTSKARIPVRLQARGHVLRRRPSATCVYTVHGLKEALGQLGLLTERGTGGSVKRIPLNYMRASIAQRMELLYGLMDTDGFRDAGHSVGIDLCHERLAEDVAELVRTFGWKVRTNVDLAKITLADGTRRTTGTRWRTNWRPDVTVFAARAADDEQFAGNQASRHTHRTIVSIDPVPTVPTVCIQVDSPRHLYLLGRDLIPTHNSWLAGYVLLNEWRCGRKAVLITLENNPPMTLDRLMCMACAIPYDDYQRGMVTPQQEQMMLAFIDEMESSEKRPLIVQIDPSQRTASGIVRKALLEDADSLIVDQLSFVRHEVGSRTQGRNFQIVDIMHDFKELIDSGIRKIPMLLLVQINRAGAQAARKEQRYRKEHLAESSAVEQTADFLWAIYQSGDLKTAGMVEFQCLKARRVPERHWELLWEPAQGAIIGQQEIDIVNRESEK